MKMFDMVRDADVSGVSGTGYVAEAVEFSDGTVVIRWSGQWRSTATYVSMYEAIQIHGHEGRTRFLPK